MEFVLFDTEGMDTPGGPGPAEMAAYKSSEDLDKSDEEKE